AHELAHLKRRDLPWGWVPALNHLLFYFHPLVWLAAREWRLAQEMACDELAVRATQMPAADYGEMLLKVATQPRPWPQPGLATVGGRESPRTLLRRLNAMHDFRPTPGRRSLMTTGALAVLALAALVPWRLTA